MINCHSLKFFREGFFFFFKFEKDNIKFGPYPKCDQFLIFVKVFYTSLPLLKVGFQFVLSKLIFSICEFNEKSFFNINWDTAPHHLLLHVLIIFS